MKHVLSVLAGLAVCTGALSSSLRAAPANDTFVNRIALRGLVVTTTGNNLGATRENGEPNHWLTTARPASVWWSWLAPASGSVTVNTTNSWQWSNGAQTSTTLDTVMAVYTGSAVGALTLVTNNDDTLGAWSEVTFTAAAGTTYQIAVAGYNAVATGAVSLNIYGPAPTGAASVTLVQTGAVWRFLDTGADPGAAWTGGAFDDSSWGAGPSPLGYGDANGIWPATTNSFGADSANKYITTYYRLGFTAPPAAAFTNYVLSVQRDDGVIVWLNGAEVFRDDMPAGPAGYLTTAVTAIGGTTESAWVGTDVSPSLVTAGANVVAVEIHQNTNTSSDIFMNLVFAGVEPAASVAAPPVVLVSAPADGTAVVAGTNVVVGADAYDNDGSVTKVDFYRNEFKIGTDSAHPYELVWSNVPPGLWALRAVATDNMGLSATSAVVNLTANSPQPISIALTSPAPGSVFVAPATVALEASVSVLSGAVDRVSFYVNGAWLADDASVPYAAAWNSVGPGSYQLMAVAAVAGGGSVTSAVVAVTVNPDQPPTVTLTAPASGASYGAPATISITATASDPDGSIAKVEFYQGASKLGESAGAPYSWTWSAVGVGAYALKAVATDNGGLSATSAVVNVTVLANLPPTVSLTSPASGASIPAPANLVLTASASDSDGTVSRVEFYAGTLYLGQTSAAPYAVVWASAPAGGYSLYAVAVDNTGARATSAPVSVTLSAPSGVSGGLALNGANQYVTFGTATNLDAATFTLELWFNWTGGGATASTGSGGVSAIPLIAKARGEYDGDDRDGNYILGIRASDSVLIADFEEGAGGTSLGLNHPVTGTTAVTPNVWHHAAVTYDGSTWNLYLDGRLDRTLAVGQPPQFNSIQHAALGSALDSSGVPQGYFHGILDEARIWDYARTGLQISNNMTVMIPVEGGLLGRWALDETSGTVAHDSAGRAIDGTLVNGPVWTNGCPLLASSVVHWIAYNDHIAGTGTAANATRYSLSTSGAPVGGVLVDFSTGLPVGPATAGVQIAGSGTINGVTGSSLAPNTDSPADLLFAGKVDWAGSALFFGADPYDAAVTITFTNLAPGRTYRFRGTAVRGAAYPGRWTFATLAGAAGAVPAHIAGSASPGIVTNGWAPYGDGLAPLTQAAWNSGDNRCGDVIGWDSIAPIGNTFSIICSNYRALVTSAPAGTLENNYCYAITAFSLEEVSGGLPLSVAFTSPTNGQVFDAPLNLAVSAKVSGALAATNIEVYANNVLIGRGAASPLSFTWTNAFEGTDLLQAFVEDSSGARATSAVVSITVNPPVTNTAPPVVRTVLPAAGPVYNTFTSIQVVFSESVAGVTASDFLVNGVPAIQVSGGGSTYVFTFAQPPNGPVAITWAAAHGITDTGIPTMVFDPAVAGNTWSYNLTDTQAPTVASKVPAAGAVVSNLTQIEVTFSERAIGVDAADLLVNGTPAFGLSGSGASYVFAVSQPPPGTVSITWAAAHGITDAVGNTFNATGAGALWQYTMQAPRITLVASNAMWSFQKGLAEVSTPVEAWRDLDYDDSAWSNAPACFYYGDPLTGTLLSDMNGLYSSVYIRKHFVVESPEALTNMVLKLQNDDGCIVWINGVEVTRTNMGTAGAADPGYAGVASANAYEPGSGVAFYGRSLGSPASFLRAGTNVIAIHAFNTSVSSSTDFAIDAELAADLWDVSALPPRVASMAPAPGTVYSLTSVTVSFTKEVVGVDAADFLVNGAQALSVTGTSNQYTFAFAQPEYGPVQISWAVGHGIVDTRIPAQPFDALSAGATWQYSLVNPNAPVVLAKTPPSGVVSNQFSQITVQFSKPVANVNAPDLLVNGVPASGVSGLDSVYTFTFPQPAYGGVAIGWAAGHGIEDLDFPPNAFNPAQAGNTWTYSFVDWLAPSILAQDPPAGSSVSNLTQLRVIFSEAVTNVDARDLRVNGIAATGVSGGGSNYLFTFAQPNGTTVALTWAADHAITDLAAVPNAFDGGAASSTWSYRTVDNVAPVMAAISPIGGVTVRTLTQVSVLFSEAVQSVAASDLLVNGLPAASVSGVGTGPYVFRFTEPSTGAVQVAWAPGQGIHDIASPANAFAGGSWHYTLDPNAVFEGSVVVSEIMFHAATDNPADQWIELHNTTDTLINLAGWRFSRGVGFAFPERDLPPRGYLVVAADLARFQAKYPLVDNVIGSWTGKLSTVEEDIEISDASGAVISHVHYADSGQWATRVAGDGDLRVIQLTSSGTTARATVLGPYVSGDRIQVFGADQADYNGSFTVTGTTGGGGPPCTACTYTLPRTPAAATATGYITLRLLTDQRIQGWGWSNPADGFGSTLELCSPALRPAQPQNWRASLAKDGTPGRANSVATNNVAPLLLDMAHSPLVPKPSESVSVTARIVDESTNGITAQVFYRNHTTPSPGAWTSAPMLDDGAHGDGLAGDGLYGAVLPAQANGTTIEFYAQATDAEGLVRSYPAPALMESGAYANSANCLYQVDDNLAPPSASNAGMPVYRLVIPGSETNYITTTSTGNRNGDAGMNATFIAFEGGQWQVRYCASVRYRGAGTRGRTPTNYRVDLPTDTRWNGNRELNFNSQYIHAQLMGSVIAGRVGAPAAQSRVFQLRINGKNLVPAGSPSGGAGFGSYIYQEAFGADWAARCLPNNAGGNFYRASKYPWTANLDYLSGSTLITTTGMEFLTWVNTGYTKASNHGDNDWTDLYRLAWTLNQVAPEADYLSAVATNVNVEAFMRYFAVNTALTTRETSIATGVGDDYALYRGIADPRFMLVSHDFDTVINEGDSTGGSADSIWRMVDSPSTTTSGQFATFLRRFMRHPEFAPVYLRELKRVCDLALSAPQFNPLIDEALGGWVTSDITTRMKTYAAARAASVLGQIPTTYSLAVPLTLTSGFYRSTAATVSLTGQANALETKTILVNGVASIYSVWEGRWTNAAALAPGINRLTVQFMGTNGLELRRQTVEVWYDNSGGTSVAGGTLASSASWMAAGGPYRITGSLAIPSGVTLTIQAGTTVYLDSGVNLTVANGGRILAEGSEYAPIHFTRVPGMSVSWGGIVVNGGPGSPETRIAHAHIEFNGTTAIHSTLGTVFLDHLTFGTTAYPYVSLDGSSFMVSDCYFPAPATAFEPAHGSGGVKSGGRGVFLRNYFGPVNGYSDVIDFTGGNRPGQPVVQFINNVFTGSGDDILDLDGTDAWVEGNIFMHVHKNGSPDTASCVSGGNDSGQTSEVTVIGNLFYDCDQAAMAKQGNFFTLVNNTIVRQTHAGGTDPEAGVICLADEGTTEALGIWMEGNIIYDAEQLVRNQTAALVTFTNNLMPLAWSGPGGGNVNADPQFVRVPALAETTNFATWAQAQVMKQWLALKVSSPAIGAGPNGRDLGGVVPMGASVSGVPSGVTGDNHAVLTVGINRSGGGIPVAGWPEGSGFTHYKWRLDGGAWSAPASVAAPISLSGLGAGAHYVEVSGQNDAGWYQDDPALGEDAKVTRTPAWTVVAGTSALRINEVLAANHGSFVWAGGTPDCLELYNAGDAEVNLYGMTLTDDLGNPDRFKFPYGTVLPAGSYLVVLADSAAGSPGLHLGFKLGISGGQLWLLDAPERGGALLDSLQYGPQVADFSVGRLAGGAWGLCQPTLGAGNRGAVTGDVHALKINEWMASGAVLFPDDFIELYNPTALPVDLSGLYLTENSLGDPAHHRVASLSYIAPWGYAVFLADGQPGQGPDHLNFRLPVEQATLGLFDAGLGVVDLVYYPPQTPDVSQGRSPNGGSNIVFFAQPTPGAPNSLVGGTNTGVVINEVLANNNRLIESDGTAPDWVELFNTGVDAVGLGDYSLTDATASPRRWVIPAGTVLAGRSYLKVRCEGTEAASTNTGPVLNTGFGLKASGGALYLFDKQAAGGSLLSVVNYGLQVADLSIGRVPDGSTNWYLCLPTPVGQNVASTLGSRAGLKINEWAAAPETGASDWFELYNPDTQPVDLSGLYLSNDLGVPKKHAIAPLSFLGSQTNAWRRFWADKTTASGADHVSFKLNKDLPIIGLATAAGALIDAVQSGPQQTGVSEGRLPDGSAAITRFPGTASPNEANYRLLTNVVISEVLTHAQSPLEQAVELFNPTDSPVSIGGWWLSNSRNFLRKFQIPAGTVIAPGRYAVFYEYQMVPADPQDPARLELDWVDGDKVYLSQDGGAGLTGWRAEEDFGPADLNVAFGRYITSDGNKDFVSMRQATFGVADPSSPESFRAGTGQSNSYPVVGPVVISEVMYHPPDMGTNDNTRDEFIALKNITAASVALYDTANPSNTWHLRNAVDFDFPMGVTLPAGGQVLVVSFDPAADPVALAAFRAAYNLSATVPVLGPFSGKLANDKEQIDLRRPLAPSAGVVPHVLVEKVTYHQGAPWPLGTDGTGLSFHRVSGSGYGNDPTNWYAAQPLRPGVTLQPASQTVTAGQPFTLEVSATNSGPFTYQWRFNGASLAGRTGPTLAIPAAQPADAGAYDVLVANLFGQSTSAVATVTVEAVLVDSDGDGMPDDWEAAHGFDPHNPADAAQDADGDGLANLQEYLAGTDPRSASSTLKLTALGWQAGRGWVFEFDMVAGRSYSLIKRGSVASGVWTRCYDIPAQAVGARIEVVDPDLGSGAQFYRLVTPALP